MELAANMEHDRVSQRCLVKSRYKKKADMGIGPWAAIHWVPLGSCMAYLDE